MITTGLHAEKPAYEMEFSIIIQNETVSFKGKTSGNNSDGDLLGPFRFTGQTPAAVVAGLHIPGDGFSIWRTGYMFREEVAISLHSDEPVLMLHFLFGAALRITVNEATYLVRNRQFNLSYFPTFHAATYAGKNPALHTVHIHFELPFLRRSVNGSRMLATFLKAVEAGNAAALSDLKHYPTREMESHIFDIFHNPYTGRNAGLFTATQVNLLLLRALDRITAGHQRKNRIGLTAADVEKLNMVREYLIQQKAETVTLARLAQVAGINTDKLKKGFYQLFGAPPIAYHEYFRLDEARRLLTDTTMTVTEVAFAVGYSSLSNFSRAFKRAFHASPVHFKRKE